MKKALVMMGLLFLSSPQHINSTNKHEVVILQATAMQTRISQGLPSHCGDGYKYSGLVVYNACSSAGAPQYEMPYRWDAGCPYPGYIAPTNVMLSQTIAELLDAGYHIHSTDPWIMIK